MHCFIRWALIVLCVWQSNVLAGEVHISGYARLVGGILDVSETSYEGYDDKLGMSADSLFAAQAEYQFTTELAITGQWMLRPKNTSDPDGSGLEWLYLTFRPSEQLQIKLGKLRTPFFTLSDYADVGFAYPWINPPQQVYDSYLFDTFNGIDTTYKFNSSGFDVTLEAYFGQESGQFDIGPIDSDFSAKNIFGLIAKANIDNFEVRASNYSAKLSLKRASLTEFRALLDDLSFYESARTLQTNGRASVNQFSIGYDNLDYFTRVEWIKISSSLDLVADISSYYISTGMNFNNITFHLTFADSDVDLASPSQQIPTDISPELDAVAAEYLAVFERSKPDALQSFTAGVRWDLFANLALKFEASTLKGTGGNNSFFINENDKKIRRGELYLFALDWVY